MVVPILKPGKNPADEKSYRPISLLCVGYEIYERVIVNRINHYIESKLPKEQFGFREKRSTELQTLLMVNHIQQNFEQRKKSGALFVDLSSAYDTVWLLGLAYKLTLIIPDFKMFQVIKDMMSNHTFPGANWYQTIKAENHQ